MKIAKKITGVASVALLASGITAIPAFSATFINSTPETARIDSQLPMVHTLRGSDHLKANILNPRPVCNAGEDYRTIVYKVNDHFLPVGTISTTNQTQADIPLTQNLSKTQSISITIKGDRTETAGANIGGDVSGKGGKGSFGISYSLAQNLGFNISYSLSWQVGQQIGPYKVPANHTGEATYGFRAITMTGTQQFCKANGTWSDALPWISSAPVKNEVRVKLYDLASGSMSETSNIGVQATSAEYQQVIEPEVTTPKGEAPAAPLAKDLSVRLTAAAGKVPGFAGLVALRVKNVGTEQYYGEYPAVQFLVKVKTADGPKGVDRLITPGYFNGAYTEDLGFDRKTSTRSFLVTLSNPIEPGEEKLIANLNFGDGNTKLGRLTNTIEVSQIKRVDGDTSTYNDIRMNSPEITTTDGGAAHNGIF
ncbi:hypothetical protein JOD55_000221 [Arcanobacterium pluranimalium]|uniref:hypothetical protein n=1 Tax=Arcanobacterium pluranimalium TaxID=108028 RepID=UPI00195D6E8E|nr:hypothetical protein [Arcanobacterium pluranimalium]MBM7824394.1 hypothetical protein [Arcanobacterium pluranimalium]